MIDVAIATCDPLPEPDPDHQPLVEALVSAGMAVETWAWDHPEARWSEAAVVLPRSTWDYYRNLDRFLGWAREVASRTRLLNPWPIIRWNHHKSYLLSLPMRGVPVVPTVAVEQGSQVTLEEICDLEGWDKVVVKPAVGAGSHGVQSVARGSLAEACLETRLEEGDMLVQPFMESVLNQGERSLVFIDGQYSHGVVKAPRFDGQAESVRALDEPTERQLEVARRAIASVEERLLYGRVDLVSDEEGAPRVAELELIEPSLFFEVRPRSVDRFVTALQGW